MLLRSSAVRSDLREHGAARRLVQRVLAEAAAQGGRTAYLFSTGAGPVWERLGFRPVPVTEAAKALSDAPQVRQYRATGTLTDEAAWRHHLIDVTTGNLPPMSADHSAADAPHTAAATSR